MLLPGRAVYCPSPLGAAATVPPPRPLPDLPGRCTGAADAMEKEGFVAAGYDYIQVDGPQPNTTRILCRGRARRLLLSQSL